MSKNSKVTATQTSNYSNDGFVDVVKKGAQKDNNDNGNKKKRKFKMPSSLVIILGVIFFVMMLTWIFHGQSVTDPMTGEVVTVTSVGLLAFGNAAIAGFADAAGVILYLFVLGAFIEIMLRSGSLEAGVKGLLNKMKNKIIWVVPILFFLFSLGGTTYGMQEETIGFFIIIVPFLVLAGFDTMTGLLVILLGSTTGFMVSTVNPFAIGAAVDSANIANVTVGTGMVSRWIIWLMATTIGALFVTWYARRVFNDKSKSYVKDTYEADLEWANQQFNQNENVSDKMTGRQKAGLWIFGLSFLIMIMMMIPWPSFIPAIESWWDAMYANGWGWLSNGSYVYPGTWYFGELIVLFSIATIALGFTFGMKGKEMSSAMWDGAKSMFSVAILIGLARSIGIIMSASGLTTFIVVSMSSGLAGMSGMTFAIMMFFVFLVFAMFIPSTSGLASASMGIVGALVVAGDSGATIDPVTGQAVLSDAGLTTMAGTLLAFSMALGIVNMFIPTQAIVMASAESSRVGYGRMMKLVGPYAIGMVVFAMIAIPLTFAMGGI